MLPGIELRGGNCPYRTGLDLARSVGCAFKRIQCTPDLLPTDVTGTQILNRQTSEFELRKGPVFCQLLLADELNRAPARTHRRSCSNATFQGFRSSKVVMQMVLESLLAF